MNDKEEYYQVPRYDDDSEASMTYNMDNYRIKHQNYFQLTDFEIKLTDTHLALYEFDPLLVMPQIPIKTGIRNKNFAE